LLNVGRERGCCRLPPPAFSVSVASKGVAGELFVSADSIEVINPLFATLTRGPGSGDSKRVMVAFC